MSYPNGDSRQENQASDFRNPQTKKHDCRSGPSFQQLNIYFKDIYNYLTFA